MTDAKKKQLSIFLSAPAALEVANGFLIVSYTTRGSDSYKLSDYDAVHLVNDAEMDASDFATLFDMVAD